MPGKKRARIYEVLIIITVVIIVSVMGYFGVSSLHLIQGRSGTNEAKTILNLIAKHQSNFRAQHGHYSLDVLGKETKLWWPLENYKFGFADVTHNQPAYASSDRLGLTPTNLKAQKIDFQKLAVMYSCQVESDHFRACAFGYPYADHETLDAWYVDEAGKITHVETNMK